MITIIMLKISRLDINKYQLFFNATLIKFFRHHSKFVEVERIDIINANIIVFQHFFKHLLACFISSFFRFVYTKSISIKHMNSSLCHSNYKVKAMRDDMILINMIFVCKFQEIMKSCHLFFRFDVKSLMIFVELPDYKFQTRVNQNGGALISHA